MSTHNINASDRRRIYRSLLKRDGNQCFWCDVEFSDEWPFTLDHLIAVSRGGSNKLENLVLSCDWCNSVKGSMPSGRFRNWLRKNYLPPEERPTGHLHKNQVKQRKNRKRYINND